MGHKANPNNPKLKEKKHKHRESHLRKVCLCTICQVELHSPSGLEAPFCETGYVRLNCGHRYHAWCFYFNEKHNGSRRCAYCRGNVEPLSLEFQVAETHSQMSFSDFFYTYSQVRL